MFLATDALSFRFALSHGYRGRSKVCLEVATLTREGDGCRQGNGELDEKKLDVTNEVVDVVSRPCATRL